MCFCKYTYRKKIIYVKRNLDLIFRCDIPWFDRKTIEMEQCSSVYEKDNSHTLYHLMENSLIHFQMGQDAEIVRSKSYFDGTKFIVMF